MVQPIDAPVPLAAVPEHRGEIVAAALPLRGTRCDRSARLFVAGSSHEIRQSGETRAIAVEERAAHGGGRRREAPPAIAAASTRVASWTSAASGAVSRRGKTSR